MSHKPFLATARKLGVNLGNALVETSPFHVVISANVVTVITLWTTPTESIVDANDDSTGDDSDSDISDDD